MKQHNIGDKPLFFISVILLLLASCGNKSHQTETEFTLLTQHCNVKLADESPTSPSCDIHLEIHEAVTPRTAATLINKEIARHIFRCDHLTLSQAMDSLRNTYTRNYREDLMPLYRADVKNGIDSQWYNYRYSIKTQYEKGYMNCICYRIDYSRYEGGAHEINQRFYLNFDPSTGKRTELKDVFSPDFRTTLLPLLLKKLEQQQNCKNKKELSEKGFLRFSDIYIPDNFKLGEEQIDFIYNTYEIAPYHEGIIQLSVSYNEIQTILKTN